jgi:hypothetical protein
MRGTIPTLPIRLHGVMLFKKGRKTSFFFKLFMVFPVVMGPDMHHHNHKRPPKILIDTLPVTRRSSKWSFHVRISDKHLVRISYLLCVTCPVSPIVRNLISLAMPGKFMGIPNSVRMLCWEVSEWFFKKQGVNMWTRFIWLRIGTSGGLVWTR